MSAPPRYCVGIDLGTTHTVVAYADAAVADAIHLFDIEQLVAPGEVAAQPLLPSLRYHPAEGELAAGELQLPWLAADVAGVPQAVVGSLARRLGAQVPGRVVASAKSWLSHGGVDRTAAILPWGADASVARVSPVAASASYLAHVRSAWDARFPSHPLTEQQLVLTLPASFDEAARALTLDAARLAGLPRLQLLEEPQAVFYDWLFRHRDRLAEALSASRLVLVCDVGGGTSDFSLIRIDAAREGETAPQLTRVAVGNHLMLGGDNMDLALAHRVEARLAGDAGAGGRAAPISAGRLSQLLERCRSAKEQLLAADAPDSVRVALLGAGRALVGGTQSALLGRDEVEQWIVDGFFPRVDLQAPLLRGRSGIVEFGLPYASDPAISRHLAAFLRQQAAACDGALPDTLLLNGGVFRGAALAERLQQQLADWRGAPLHLLDNADPDTAVARGAVAFALARQRRSPQIGGGSARSYFLVLDAARPKDGEAPPRRAVCVLPRGAEPGREWRLAERTFALRLGQPVRFHLVSSVADAPGESPPQLGQIVELDGGDYRPLPPLASVVAAEAGRREARVQLETVLTEVGTLQLQCVSMADAAQRWQLEFELRVADASDTELQSGEALPKVPGLGAAVDLIDQVFGSRSREVDARAVRQLRAQLEQRLGARERWPTPLLRQLFDALWRGARNRRRSADHERIWLNLAGWCLRPGFGAPLDEWRVQQLWTLFEHGVQHGGDAQVSAEWWTLWRRAAGGLDADAQRRLLDDFAYNLQGRAAGVERPPRLVKGGEDDMVRLIAALERIDPEHKAEIGDWLLGRIATALRRGDEAPPPRGGRLDADRLLWALGRLGARRPLHASAHQVLPAETATHWLDTLLALDWKRTPAAAFAAAHLARVCGDRSRDLPDVLRERVAERLQAARVAPHWVAMVREQVELDEAGERQAYGEALPPGLRLIG